ncbi:hypothetical protein ACLESD_33465, partial [Pyxidicoccus sp. 3LFB2]
MSSSFTKSAGGPRLPQTAYTQQTTFTQAPQQRAPSPPPAPPPAPPKPKDTYVASQPRTRKPSITATVTGDAPMAPAARMSPAQLMALAAKGFAATLPRAGAGAGG